MHCVCMCGCVFVRLRLCLCLSLCLSAFASQGKADIGHESGSQGSASVEIRCSRYVTRSWKTVQLAYCVLTKRVQPEYQIIVRMLQPVYHLWKLCIRYTTPPPGIASPSTVGSAPFLEGFVRPSQKRLSVLLRSLRVPS